jgi:hypothetical protein
MFGPPLPTLSDPFSSLTVLAPAIGSDGLTEAPCGGASAAAGSHSAALLGLNVNAEETSCVAAAFSAVTSPRTDASGSAGPLTVVRLLRIVLLLEAFDDLDWLELFGGCEDFAITRFVATPVETDDEQWWLIRRRVFPPDEMPIQQRH